MKFSILTGAFLLVVSSTLLGQQQPKNTSVDSASSVSKELLTLIVSDSLFLTYFFEELNIVDYQQEKLKKLVLKKRKERQSLVADWIEEKGSARAKLGYEKLADEFASEVQEILLPKQLAKLRQLTRQRAKLVSMNGAEGFLLPFFTATELGLSKEDLKKLQSNLEVVVGKFKTEKDKIAKESWDEIRKLMPKGSVSEIVELATLAPGVDKLDVSSKRLRISDLKTWKSDDFDKFEKSRYYLAAGVAVGHEPLSEALGILDHQKSDFQTVYKETIAAHDTAEFADPVLAQMILATPSGRLTKLKAKTRKQLEKREEFDADMTSRIATSVLLPAQNEKLKRLAKFIRWMYEVKMNDEFGIVIAWAKSVDDKTFDSEAFVKQADKSRAQYYEKLSKLRESTYEKVLADLPDAAREKYRELFGSPYDYAAEKTNAWDELRKNSRKE